MKKFFSAIIITVGLSVGINAIANSTIGDGNLHFFVNNGTILAPVLQDNDGTGFGFYNLDGEAINPNGSSRVSTAPIPQTEIAARIAVQYNSGNATITFPNPPLN